MKNIVLGHEYSLKDHEGDGTQIIQFISKENVNGELKTIKDGTTNEEVLKMLIDRMQYLQNIQSSRENAVVITKLEEALMWLEKRTADRVARGVEGTTNK